MTATPDTTHAVLSAVRESHPQWPYADSHDTVDGDPWPLAWGTAAFIEEWFAHPDHNNLEEALCHLPLDPMMKSQMMPRTMRQMKAMRFARSCLRSSQM